MSIACKTGAELNTVELLAEEATAATHFSRKRLAEFSLGRACAREILAALGYAEFPLRVGDARQPLWPPGLTGSISHAGDMAICAIAPVQDIAGIGIDIETVTHESFDLLEMVASSRERAAMTAMPADFHYLPKLLFSAKESVFKCQFPLTRQWLEFQDVSLALDFAHRGFATTITDRNETLAITGTWDVTDRYILTVAWLA